MHVEIKRVGHFLVGKMINGEKQWRREFQMYCEMITEAHKIDINYKDQYFKYQELCLAGRSIKVSFEKNIHISIVVKKANYLFKKQGGLSFWKVGCTEMVGSVVWLSNGSSSDEGEK